MRESDYDNALNLLRKTTINRLFLAILFSFLTVVGAGSVACGDLLLAPSRVAVPHGHSRVYRAVSEAEYQDILRTGQLRQGPNSMEGKWFADTMDGVRLHGDALEGAGKYRIIEVDIPNNLPSLHLDPNLDLRGPARYLDGTDLPNLKPRPFGG